MTVHHDDYRFRASRLKGPRFARPLRIAMLAPPWIPVPPRGYGGIEEVVDILCEQLVSVGHQVTLFAAPGSESIAEVHPLLAEARPGDIGQALYESDHVAGAFAAIDAAAAAGEAFQVVHDHSGFTALAMADRLATPLVHTLHGPFTPETAAFYAEHGHKAEIVAISATQLAAAPQSLGSAVIPNPMRLDDWPFGRSKSDYFLWIGRMTEVKGAHRAIRAARMAGKRLVLAGPVQPGQERYFRDEVEPWIDGTNIVYMGEVADPLRKSLFVDACGLLMPIRWPEPFGMVMIEALAAGTPVISFAEGSAAEIVLPGRTGFLVDDEAEMAAAMERLDTIDPVECRRSVAARYDPAQIAARYVEIYRLAIRNRRRSARLAGTGV